jgi:hypothetical protein
MIYEMSLVVSKDTYWRRLTWLAKYEMTWGARVQFQAEQTQSARCHVIALGKLCTRNAQTNSASYQLVNEK